MNELANKFCVPCHGGVSPLKGKELTSLHQKLGNGWNIIEAHHLEK
mgnify:CR=1 FL=1